MTKEVERAVPRSLRQREEFSAALTGTNVSSARKDEAAEDLRRVARHCLPA